MTEKEPQLCERCHRIVAEDRNKPYSKTRDYAKQKQREWRAKKRLELARLREAALQASIEANLAQLTEFSTQPTLMDLFCDEDVSDM